MVPGAPGTAGAPSASAAPADVFDLAAVTSPESWRFGAGMSTRLDVPAWLPRLGAGWWYDWSVRSPAPSTGDYWQMIRMTGGRLDPPVTMFAAEAARLPGQVWIVGNEPDVIWQDGVYPACAAYLYHQAYAALKRADPTARVGPGGITQASPLRLAYLDAWLDEYRARYGAPLPAEVWTMHAFVLREERGSWGVDIPPGQDVAAGWLLPVDDHDNVESFKWQILTFRRWMADRGYGDRPLAITEFGILMPPDYGFGPERVGRFMTATFDFLLSARDPAIGLASDGGRLVQQWAWFSLADPLYPTGDLVDARHNGLTPLGLAYRQYVAATVRR